MQSNPSSSSAAEQIDILIAVMGATGSGKTTFVNMASGDDLTVGASLRSCTSDVQICKPFKVDGRTVTLVDTPGFDDTDKSDTDVLAMIAAFLNASYEQGRKLAGLIYMHRISDYRMGGLSARNFRMLRRLCGDTTLKNLVIVTNMWGDVSLSVGEARERELATQDKFFKQALDKGAKMLRHTHSFDSAINILRYALRNTPLPLKIQEEMVDEGKDLPETGAGAELNAELEKLMKKHEEDMRALKAELEEAVRLKEEETRQELDAEIVKLRDETNRIKLDARDMASKYDLERSKLEAQIRKSAERTATQQAQMKKEYEGELKKLKQQALQNAGNTEDILDLRHKVLQLETQIANMPRPRPKPWPCTIM
ncbi:hypothetical protein PC9H_010600 [Pleurotus ostreatus]|uniref:G domain-containing protein n=1 Tax=Pleurotus ostreatus TaxID=5322 RepID=A0A8H7DNS6_PLEOS|nr:uncharacterized protein PC9H_010600 [Pleurotus ostreatus]KAF7422444.1 hypothetical protein PC9H_010600 [Pleurotus ostreatus]KAJ8691710.1 hypothetical protein PTI98_011251 [Pleurotus ostreatus]